MSKQKAETFGEMVRRMRNDQGLTQEALAGEAGITQAFLCGIECGRKQPAWSTIQALTAALGAEIRFLPSENEDDSVKSGKTSAS